MQMTKLTDGTIEIADGKRIMLFHPENGRLFAVIEKFDGDVATMFTISMVERSNMEKYAFKYDVTNIVEDEHDLADYFIGC